METNFHFEVAGDLFDDELIQLLSQAPEGLIQLEIGVQSVNPETHSEIKRKTDINKLFGNVRKLLSNDNIHIHLDLIAGLPYEDYSSFRESFNTVYRLKPHYLQLGFLKMLKGSYIRSEDQIKKHQYKFREYPPYEVLYNKYISFAEIAELKGIEEVLERYYNSGRFVNTLKFIVDNFFSSPFDFYRELYLYNLHHGHLDKPISARDHYTVFVDFVEYLTDKLGLKDDVKQSLVDVINDLLKLDFMSTNNTGKLPEKINRVSEPGFKDWCRDFLKDENHVKMYLPEFVGMSPGQILNKVKFETFSYNIVTLIKAKQNPYSGLISDCSKSDADSNSGSTGITNLALPEKKKVIIVFDYSNHHKVTGRYRYVILQ